MFSKKSKEEILKLFSNTNYTIKKYSKNDEKRRKGRG